MVQGVSIPRWEVLLHHVEVHLETTGKCGELGRVASMGPIIDIRVVIIIIVVVTEFVSSVPRC